MFETGARKDVGTGRCRWGAMVASQMAETLPSSCHLILLAGADYRVELLPWRRRLSHAVDAPIPRSLRMAEQTKWLREQTMLS